MDVWCVVASAPWPSLLPAPRACRGALTPPPHSHTHARAPTPPPFPPLFFSTSSSSSSLADIFRERLGFKLIWGCLCWYPNFYFVPLAAAVEAPVGSDVSAATAGACVALFFVGWAFTRGANMQKFYCKTAPAPPRGQALPPFLGLFSMDTVPGTDGRVLCGGFWGLSRHVNYAGEIVQALALAVLAVLAGGSAKALLYPLYYFAIFLPRQVDDDAICEAKYGKKVWGEYCARVPFRIFPGIY